MPASEALLKTLTSRIVAAFRRCGNPMFLGELSLESGYNLQYTQEAVDVLVAQGRVRPATSQEVAKTFGDSGALVYVLIK